jgi:hypothetical protein
VESLCLRTTRNDPKVILLPLSLSAGLESIGIGRQPASKKGFRKDTYAAVIGAGAKNFAGLRLCALTSVSRLKQSGGFCVLLLLIFTRDGQHPQNSAKWLNRI